MDFLQKLDSLKRLKGDSDASLARRSGLPYSTVRGLYEKNSNNVKLPTLMKLSEYFGVSIDYLVKDDIELERQLQLSMFSDDAFQMLSDFDDLDEFGKKAVRAVLDVQMERMEVDAVKPLPGFVCLPHFDSPAAAGEPLWAEGNYRYLRYPMDARSENADFTVKLSGHSMEPDYPDGCTVFVRRSADIEDGDVVIAWLAGEGSVCKRAIVRGERVLKLESINRAFDDYSGAALEDMKVYGKVIGHTE